MIYSFYSRVALGIMCVVLIGCGESDSPTLNHTTAITDTTLIITYPELYNAVYSRNADLILPYTDHESEPIRAQAWRAMAQTPVDSLSAFIEKVKEDGSAEAWFALSMHPLSEEQLRDLETHWSEHPGQRSGISLVLGQQGDTETLAFLVDHVDEATGSSYEKAVALAKSRLLNRVESTKEQKASILHHSFTSSDPQLIRSRLYGFYRGPDDMLSDVLKDSLIVTWKKWGIGKSAAVDQYMVKIGGPGMIGEIVQHYDSAGTLNHHVQLGIELAQMSDEVERKPANEAALKTLITHENPHVVQQTLAGLTGRLKTDEALTAFIKEQIADNSDTEPFIWLQALNTWAETNPDMIAPYATRLQTIAEDNPYLYPQALAVWMKTETGDAFLNRLEGIIEQGDPLKSMYAINALDDYRSRAGDVRSMRNRIRQLLFAALALGDRGVTYATQPLLEDATLFSKSDFDTINRYLHSFELPGDIEVYQTFGSLYKKRYEEQAQPVIDSLAALNYPPLNRSLKQAGWNVEVSDEIETEFRTPNWDRLWELGEHPVWVLETEKGNIKIEMNTLSAPATVSAIDSLTRAGAYNGVPFHRVVPNFVIQGGDIEREDGFGGPSFTIPTEASELSYVRGAAGIASAGPDTEGSQYFFMHQWKPHLNGRYTLFGNVVEGMDVVDRITMGDEVIRGYWQTAKN